MSSAYYRKKKHLFLKRIRDLNEDEVEERCVKSRNSCQNGELDISIQINVNTITEEKDNIDISEKSFSPVSNHDVLTSNANDSNFCQMSFEESSSVFNDESAPLIPNPNIPVAGEVKNVESSFRDKLHALLLRHISHTTKTFTTELLDILRKEGYVELPKSAAILLNSNKYSKKEIKRMKVKSHRESHKRGYYIYFGIAENLSRIISPTAYDKRTIKLLVNIDGLPIFNHSKQQFWPILCLVLDPDYESSPFLVAVFCGHSKPNSVHDFLKDFVEEIAQLSEDGLEIEGEFFTVKIVGFVCDTPARSFLKCCKGHGGFFACERCEVKGSSVENRRGNKKRVYANIRAKLRTNRSFRRQTQKEHHHGTSPLLRIPGFDPVKMFLLDSMHLLYIGLMKWLLEQWITGNNRKTKISPSQKEYLRKMLLELADVPDDFQRKNFDLDDLSNWKATQYRFFMHYSSVVCLRKILSEDLFHHYMLFFVATRILCSSELAVRHVSYAKELLEKFVYLIPSFYGEDAQNITIHNLIHIADDVEYMGVELSAISAFTFENCLGWIKSIIRGKKKPLHQLVRRISELHSCPEGPDIPEVKHPLRKRLCKKVELHVELYKNSPPNSNDGNVKKIFFRGLVIDSNKGNNTIQLRNGSIVRITKISTTPTGSIIFEGTQTSRLVNLFEYPCDSKDIGIYKLGSPSTQVVKFGIEKVWRKCVILTVDDKRIAVSFLHS